MAAPATPSYTNLVLTSEEQASTNVYNNGLGYKNGYKASDGSAGAESAASGYVVTGFIPYTWDSSHTIYIRGATIDNTANTRFYGYTNKANGTVSSSCYASGARINDTANNIWFDWEEIKTGYYKLTPKNNRTDITHIRISLLGTGENLIVTVNEPIE